jgi:hypothetical protein
MQPPSIPALQAELSRHFGFRVPDAFARFIHHALAECSKDGAFDNWDFYRYYPRFGFNMPVEINYDSDRGEWTYTPNESYDSYYNYGLPPELCMFGSMDSLRFGFIVHDPSLQQPEWPVGKVSDREFGVIRYGDTTAQGWESLISLARAKDNPDQEELRKYEALEKLFNLHPRPEEIVAEVVGPGVGTYDGEKPSHAVPVIPPGWRHEPSSDGIGVLAPASMFASHELEELEDTDDAAQLIADGYHATALLALRETLWVNWHSGKEPFYEECALLMKDAYVKMGRPLFAHRVQQQINYMRKLGF